MFFGKLELTLRTCSKAECVFWGSTRMLISKALFAHGMVGILAGLEGEEYFEWEEKGRSGFGD